METKVCTKCKQEFPLTSKYFHKRSDGSSSFRSHCIICTRLKNNQRSLIRAMLKTSVNTEQEYKNLVLHNLRKRGFERRKYKYDNNEVLTKAEYAKAARNNLSISYLCSIYRKRGIKITPKILKKYSNIIISLRMLQNMKRAYKYTKIPKNYNINFDFKGDKILAKKTILKEYQQAQRNKLTDYYVLNQFVYNLKLKGNELKQILPLEVIEAKRNQLKLHRECQQH